MEGSWHYKDVENYAELAKYYDLLLQDEASLKYWLAQIERFKAKSVLELASGSGVMARILKEKGYDIIASDLSSAMKEIALKTNFDGDYRILNMIDFKLDQTFDMILCFCDSINYLEDEALLGMFKNIYEHLNDGGVFLFDMHHKERINEFEEEYIEEGYVLDVAYQWSIIADREDASLHERFTFYEEDGIIQEHHTQHVFAIEDVKNALEMANFKVEIIEDFIENEKVFVIGEKNDWYYCSDGCRVKRFKGSHGRY